MGYDIFGFDEYGYNKDGFDRMGYDRDGFDRMGYNKRGFNRNGINKLTQRDKDGFDQAGFDAEGFDRNGFNYNGFNRDGFDKNGFDPNGFDKNGFDADGFDQDGFNKDGFDRTGYNREGRDKYGFDHHGLDSEGFDRDGFDANGWNRDGFDRDGFNRDGFDKDGFDKAGYDRNGFDRNGLDSAGYDKDGFNIFGCDAEGYNLLGLDKDGFDRDGLNAYGFCKTDFDENGFNIYTGLDLEGFDREGFNINGISRDGYGRDGFHVVTGLDRNGYDRDGFDANGFNKEGINRDGYDRYGKDIYGFTEKDKTELKRQFEAEKKVRGKSYLNGDPLYHNIYGIGKVTHVNQNGTIVVLFDSLHGTMTFDPKMAIGKILFYEDPEPDRPPVDSSEDEKERKHFSDTIHYVNTEYRKIIYNQNMRSAQARIDSSPVYLYFDKDGFLHSSHMSLDELHVRHITDLELTPILHEPYFAHVLCRIAGDVYIGKNGVPDHIYDWAAPEASYYYNHNVVHTDQSVGLVFVRDILMRNHKYYAYKTLCSTDVDITNTFDSRLTEILKENATKKEVHDIIASIQANQYNIITADINSNIQVLGCAGSGKTMIMMHRIRFSRYNHPEIPISDYCVISPTDILGRESKTLSRILRIGQIQQYSTHLFYAKTLQTYLSALSSIQWTVTNSRSNLPKDYQTEPLQRLSTTIKNSLNPHLPIGYRYLNNEKTQAEKEQQAIISEFAKEKILFRDTYLLYQGIRRQIIANKYTSADIQSVLLSIDTELHRLPRLNYELELLTLMHSVGCFKGKTAVTMQASLPQTENLLTHVDIVQFNQELHSGKHQSLNSLRILQLLYTFNDTEFTSDALLGILKEWSFYSSESIERLISNKAEHRAAISSLEEIKLIFNTMIAENIFPSSYEATDSNHTCLTYHDISDISESIQKMKEQVHSSFTMEECFHKLTHYWNLECRNKRISDQSSTPAGNAFLVDSLIQFMNLNCTNNVISLNETEAFQVLYILVHQLGAITNRKQYMFIDEFQDYSPGELVLISKLFPNSVVNYYGDIHQCITDKGIAKAEDIPMPSHCKTYRIQENYRNAKEITEYVNRQCNMDMTAIGLHGQVSVSEKLPDILIAPDDRVAIIVSDITSPAVQSLVHELSEKVSLYQPDRGIIKGRYNLLCINDVKGLEFETVIVYEAGLNENQKYVAYTRAIQQLYIIRKSSESTTLTDSVDNKHPVYSIRTQRLHAHGYPVKNSQKFVVMKGSEIAPQISSCLHSVYISMRRELISKGIIKNNIFQHDYTFKSSSTAANIVLGRASNGKIEWILPDGSTLGDNLSQI